MHKALGVKAGWWWRRSHRQRQLGCGCPCHQQDKIVVINLRASSSAPPLCCSASREGKGGEGARMRAHGCEFRMFFLHPHTRTPIHTPTHTRAHTRTQHARTHLRTCTTRTPMHSRMHTRTHEHVRRAMQSHARIVKGHGRPAIIAHTPTRTGARRGQTWCSIASAPSGSWLKSGRHSLSGTLGPRGGGGWGG